MVTDDKGIAEDPAPSDTPLHVAGGASSGNLPRVLIVTGPDQQQCVASLADAAESLGWSLRVIDEGFQPDTPLSHPSHVSVAIDAATAERPDARAVLRTARLIDRDLMRSVIVDRVIPLHEDERLA